MVSQAARMIAIDHPSWGLGQSLLCHSGIARPAMLCHYEIDAHHLILKNRQWLDRKPLALAPRTDAIARQDLPHGRQPLPPDAD